MGRLKKALHCAAAMTSLVAAGAMQASAGLMDLSTLTATNQAWSDSVVTLHNAGGSASNFSGTTSISYGAVGSNGLSILPPSILSGSGVMFVGDSSYAGAILGDPPFPNRTFYGTGLSQLDVTNYFVIGQQTFAIRNSADANPTYTNSADLKSVIEIETPNFGPGQAIFWELDLDDYISLPNGGSATNTLVEASVVNVTTGDTLFIMSGPLSGFIQNQTILSAAPGDILRFSFQGSTSSVLPIGTNPFGSSNLSFTSFFTTVAAPVPEPASIALLGTGLAGVGGMQLRRRLNRNTAA